MAQTSAIVSELKRQLRAHGLTYQDVAQALAHLPAGHDFMVPEVLFNKITDDQRADAFLKESDWVVIHSSSRHYIDLDIVGDVVAGKRSRMSFAPMVISTGQLMCYEVIQAILGRPHGTDNRGYFFNPYKARVERPKPALIAALLRPVVRRFLTGLMS